ncbi:EmrB/QacA subfamily drug resistance transporter [Leucobacter luti]|uniref:MFS transporter n=1 Tax=Leucobacter luti TaxID=340320 RepID=UPI0010518F4F|nr:MFS transporter [Leucobacter luti]MCW2287100.1 EmrB/QacA subfamily drug resistance transporter [Leucobacter luti]TCK41325.1 EmrB/QacA subfamily drug resistance transporter [Leucobacter luti]
MSTPQPISAAKRWLGLVLIATAQFVVIMDTSIIGVALPDIQRELGFTPESLSWVFNAYVVTFGGLLLLGGRLSDLFGARKIFALGWVILIAGSLMAGAASTVGLEIAGRVVQGAGSALIAPAALTLLMMLFGGTSDLPKAFAVYGAAAPIGGSAGVFLGGVLTEYVSWPWVFYVTVPIALFVLAFTATALPRTPRKAAGSIDIGGALTVTLGLAAVVYAVVNAPEVGWLTVQTLGVSAGGVALLIVFFIIQARSKNPLLRLGLLRAPLLAAANNAQLMLGAAWVSMWFFLNLYLQQVLGASAFAAGAALLPMTGLVVIIMIAVAPRLQARFGAKALIVSGLLILAAGLLWLSFVRPDGSYAVDVLPASLLAALGMSLAFVPSLGTAINAAPPAETGVASGLVSTSYQIGSALGLAVLTAIVYGVSGAAPSTVELTQGYSAAFIGASALALIGAVITALAMRTPSPAPAPAETPISA